MPSRHTLRRAATWALLAATVLVLVSAAGWRMTGGRWFVVTTPSMGRAAPVGTLLLTRPTSARQVTVGDVVTFHSPSGVVYSHRVVAKSSDGVLTRGDINGVDDPWRTTDRQLIGRVVARCWACGWLLRALPLLLGGLALSFGVSALLWRWRSPVRQLGTWLTTSATSFWLHPWVGVEKIGVTQQGRHLSIRAVSTGILPVSVRDADGGRPTTLVAGQVGNVAVTHHNARGAYDVVVGLHLGLWWWVGVVACCLAPMVVSMVATRVLPPAGPTVEAPVEQPSSDHDDGVRVLTAADAASAGAAT